MNRVNANDFVYVVPTEDGAKIYNEDVARRNLKLPEDLHRQRVAAGEILKIQLWSLMQIFGPREGQPRCGSGQDGRPTPQQRHSSSEGVGPEDIERIARYHAFYMELKEKR